MNIILRNLAIAFMVLSISEAQSETLNLDISLHAYHWNRSTVSHYNLNEMNTGVGLRWMKGEQHKMFGVYRNSNRKNSVYALLAWTPIKVGSSSKGGGIIGIVTGYNTPYAPAAGLYTIVPMVNNISINLTVTPNVPRLNVWGFVGFQMSKSI